MSKVAITGNASGTGVFTVASPNSNVDRVLTLPDETGTVDTLQRSGNVIQVVNFQTGAVATGTTVIPFDDTIPQITEGNEYMTLAITPTNASNILYIDVITFAGASIAGEHTAALFKDTTANALAAICQQMDTADRAQANAFTHKITAGTTSEITFRVRLGMQAAGTTTFNGLGATRRFGGVAASSITITEVTP
jgi:hypothetical protein